MKFKLNIQRVLDIFHILQNFSVMSRQESSAQFGEPLGDEPAATFISSVMCAEPIFPIIRYYKSLPMEVCSQLPILSASSGLRGIVN